MISVYTILVSAILVLEFVTTITINNNNINELPEVTRFREYLRINSAHPAPDYDGCIKWLETQALQIGLDFNIEHYPSESNETNTEPTNFAVWLTWIGTRPELKSILLDSHMDVVAADPSKWDHDPFEAFKDEDGNIFARGVIDMKSATAATLEAIRRLKMIGYEPLRTIHISILPDEELYSRGVKAFVNSSSFKELNVGFTIDESNVSPNDNDMYITYREKSVWQFNYTVHGAAMHGSFMPENTAGEKLGIVIDRLMEYRKTQLDILQDPSATLENVTSLNLIRTGGGAGAGNNIIPHELWASFDMRILTKPGWELSDFENMLNRIAKEAGNDTTITYLVQAMDSAQTPIDDTNIWWTVLQSSCQELNTTCIPRIPSGVTDGRYIRNTGIPVFGINPFPSTVSMAHQDNEMMNESNFLKGIDRYVILIKNFASENTQP